MFYKIILHTASEPVERPVRASREVAEKLAHSLARIYHADEFTIEELSDPAELKKFISQLAALCLMLMLSFGGAMTDQDIIRTTRTRNRRQQSRISRPKES